MKNEAPKNCPVCPSVEKSEKSDEPQAIPGGFSWKEVDYHSGDFVFLQQTEGPCTVAQIKSFQIDQRAHRVILQVIYLYRVMDLRPENVVLDEVRPAHLRERSPELTSPPPSAASSGPRCSTTSSTACSSASATS